MKISKRFQMGKFPSWLSSELQLIWGTFFSWAWSVGPCSAMQCRKIQRWFIKTMKNKGFGHLKTRLFTIKASKSSKNVGLGGPWYNTYIYIVRNARILLTSCPVKLYHGIFNENTHCTARGAAGWRYGIKDLVVWSKWTHMKSSIARVNHFKFYLQGTKLKTTSLPWVLGKYKIKQTSNNCFGLKNTHICEIILLHPSSIQL